MGFSGGGSNVLLPHTHDGRVAQDGGELDFNNITQANSSAGQIFYSNGTALQQLAYPGVPAGETLTAAAASTAPAWVAGAGPGASTFALVDTQELTGSAAYIDSTFTTISGEDVSQLQIVLDLQRSNTATCDVLLQYGTGGALVTSAYYTTQLSVATAANVTYNNQAEWLLARNPAYQHFGSLTQLYVADPDLTTGSAYTIFLGNSTSAGPEGYICTGTNDGILTTCDQIRVSVSAGTLDVGSKMSIYRLNRT